MRIIVTGGAGFIGCNLIQRLLLNKNNTVFNIDKLSYASSTTAIDTLLKSENSESLGKYEFHKLNLENQEDTENILDYINPDLIMHLAAESHVDRSIDNPENFIASNIVGTFNLLEATRKSWQKFNEEKRNSFRFHHISTDEVFGSLGSYGSFSEETPYNPRSPYAASKASSDHLVKSWHHTFGLPIILTNCSNNFGPWQFPEKLIPLTIHKAYRNESIPLYGNGENIRDWLFIDDHIDALLLVASKGVIGQSYCIGGKGEKTNKEVVLEICQIMDRIRPSDAPHKNLIKYVKDRPGHDERYAINPTKIKKELGWESQHSFTEGLKKTINWYMHNLDWFEKIASGNSYNFERLGEKK
tara:strand:- start:33 stop:1103 length:1071 start_codon:yes stop_codon:yes gene_type:complete